MTEFFHDIRYWIYTTVDLPHHTHFTWIILLVLICVAAVLSYFLSKLVLYALEYLIEKSPTKWDDDLLNRRFMRAVAQLAPALVVNWMLPGFFTARDGSTIAWIKTLTSLYILWAAIYILIIFLNNLYIGFRHRDNTKSYAIKGIFQMLKLIAIGAGIIVGISILIGREPIVILTTLGASAAVLMLVFKDTILGLVASVQLSANKMLHRGDWVIVDKYNANGEVEDISLTTVKIRNWDNSISTIPPYAMITDSFRNYQPMRDLGGRRVERCIYIDLNSIRFLEKEEIDELKQSGWLEGISVEKARHQVNLNLLRRYLEHYLAHHHDVNPDMLLMVRQMEPTQSGLPLQLYFFTRSTKWKDFEHIQSNIFDHVYAVVHKFGLHLFQTPTGLDVLSLRGGESGWADGASPHKKQVSCPGINAAQGQEQHRNKRT